LAVLWEIAWLAEQGESRERDTFALQPEDAMAVCASAKFLPSVTVTQIGKFLGKPPHARKGEAGQHGWPSLASRRGGARSNDYACR